MERRQGGIKFTVYSLILIVVIFWRLTGLLARSDEADSAHLSRRAAETGMRVSMDDALTLEGFSKRFGGLRAVQDLSFSVKEGQTVALIRPDGTRKTTCFDLITALSVQTGFELGLRPGNRRLAAA